MDGPPHFLRTPFISPLKRKQHPLQNSNCIIPLLQNFYASELIFLPKMADPESFENTSKRQLLSSAFPAIFPLSQSRTTAWRMSLGAIAEKDSLMIIVDVVVARLEQQEKLVICQVGWTSRRVLVLFRGKTGGPANISGFIFVKASHLTRVDGVSSNFTGLLLERRRWCEKSLLMKDVADVHLINVRVNDFWLYTRIKLFTLCCLSLY